MLQHNGDCCILNKYISFLSASVLNKSQMTSWHAKKRKYGTSAERVRKQPRIQDFLATAWMRG